MACVVIIGLILTVVLLLGHRRGRKERRRSRDEFGVEVPPQRWGEEDGKDGRGGRSRLREQVVSYELDAGVDGGVSFGGVSG